MMEPFERSVSKLEIIFKGDWSQRMVHYCRGCHNQINEGKQDIIDAGTAAIDEAGVWPCDLTNPSVSRFGSTAQCQARQLLPKLLHRIEALPPKE